ncbi:hybrid sensor histidine kinase/response regulator [Corallococcus exiguus]|uniref:ATP-binding response regulator n=1 Tax=Corallococcus TaxID=83461 RepID=UPI000ED20067|nr:MULTISPECIES: hybrid sensor histidine kinase/response regulator [Corallococcus]NNB85957.1 hybrid sensor histidine kinase/response regulator [Corallococcus exiguus]NNC02418.1 hybrid sensor histidine kinase/response regulator [Corallococcus exiguus]NPC47861.1 hybrid sensor histidine kinase/response regulator [Corallococcus exiguus]RKH84137.1 hybrid sensor histidine kinase/response regulator [Corallococcus sp. AB032C]
MSLVLIAEDEEALLEVFSEVVEDLGHRVIRAHNGEEALLLARTETPDLVVSDHMMPRRTGMQLLHAMRSEPTLSDVPFLLLSAARPQGREAAQTFLAKPVDLTTFEQAVSNALQYREATRTDAAPAAREPVSSVSLAREEMLNWVAHELKTPLSSARLNTQLLLRKVQKRGIDDERRSAEGVLRQLDRMNGLVTSILDASRLADGKLELKLAPTDLTLFLQELVQEWRELQPEMDFSLHAVEAVEPLMLDAERLRQVLNNLVSNAVKYSGTSRHIELGVALNPGLVLIHVRDWGVGIPAGALPHVFDRFQRADEDRGRGHGLGLFIAAALAKLHGGSLSARSTLGEGSTFTLRLPRRN